MQKPLAAFAISFFLSMGFTYLSFDTRLFTLFSVTEPIPIFTLSSMLFNLVLLAVVFGVFYFLADKFNMRASKSTVVALLIGVIFGSAINDLLSISPQYYNTYTSIIVASSSVGGVFEFFLPSIIALLFVELKHEQANRAFTPS
jgi:hypothetical protein